MSFDGLDIDELQPNSLMCFCCGIHNAAGLRIRFFNAGPGQCVAYVMLGNSHQGFPGIAHGGVTATMLDEAMCRAALSGDSNRLVYTAKMEVRYRKPVPLHTRLILRGVLDKDRGAILTAHGNITLPDGTLLADGAATVVEVPKDELAKMNTPEVGWQIYPLE
jgi:acyl-coenzyme A thioesterase PaaI-like protein